MKKTHVKSLAGVFLIIILLMAGPQLAAQTDTTGPPALPSNTLSPTGVDSTASSNRKKAQEFSAVADGGVSTNTAAVSGTAAETNYKPQAVGLAVACLCVLVVFFVGMSGWLQRIRRSSLFMNRFRDTIEADEFERLDAAIQKRVLSGHYFRTVVIDAEIKAAVPGATPSPLLRPELAPELKNERPWLQADVEDLLQSQGRNVNPVARGLGSSWSAPPGLGGSIRSTEEGEQLGPAESEEQSKRQSLDKMQEEWHSKVRDWSQQVRSQADMAIRKERNEAEARAKEMADKAISIDPNAIMGRTPSLMLEFTAVVVIIFATVILGILAVLKEQQIGTLLAAIAGYVLGRAAGTGRSQGESAVSPSSGSQSR
jgi:hypothetical protein